MPADNAPPVMDADDWYDQDILTGEDCPECGSKIVSYPDCTEGCSNSRCCGGDRHIKIDC